MTKNEKAEVERAIQLFQSDDGYHEAMAVLLKLIGRKDRVGEMLKSATPIRLSDIRDSGVTTITPVTNDEEHLSQTCVYDEGIAFINHDALDRIVVT